MREHWNEEWQKSVQESRVVKCYFWETAWKRAHNVVSFSKLFLRGNKQEYSASCYRLDASKVPVKNSLLYQTSVMHAQMTVCAGCSSAGASKKPSLLSSGSPGHVSRVTGAWTVTGTMSATSSVGPQPGWYFTDLSLVLVQLAGGASWSLQISSSAACIIVSFLLSWVVSHLCYHNRTQRRIFWAGKLKVTNSYHDLVRQVDTACLSQLNKPQER